MDARIRYPLRSAITGHTYRIVDTNMGKALEYRITPQKLGQIAFSEDGGRLTMYTRRVGGQWGAMPNTPDLREQAEELYRLLLRGVGESLGMTQLPKPAPTPASDGRSFRVWARADVADDVHARLEAMALDIMGTKGAGAVVVEV